MRLISVILCLVVTGSHAVAQQPSVPSTLFRTSRDLVSIDVVVRDRTGAVVRGLTAADFEIREDGQPQEILTTSFEEAQGATATPLEGQFLQRLGRPPMTGSSGSSELAGRRLILLLFDLSGMEPEEVERGVGAALRFVETQMTAADLVAVASLTWQLTVLTDFTTDRESLRDVLERLVPVDVSTGETMSVEASEASVPARSVVATDARLRALRLLADALSPIAQKKALLYFSAGLANAAQDTPAELRAATTAAARANLAVYPVDTRGLQAVIPSGPARVPSREGEGLFSGRDVNDQFTDLTASQDTMAAIASSTGGRMFSGANDVSAAFTRVQQDTAAYYLLGYSTTNAARDGKFRRVRVRVRRDGLRVEARAGYYGERDFAHMSRADKEAQLEEYLIAPPLESRLPVKATIAWTRMDSATFMVPLAITVALPVPPLGEGRDAFDVLAVVQDEQGRTMARLRDTMTVPSASANGASELTYTSGVVLPPGRFLLKSVLRENGDGMLGVASTEIRLPDLNGSPLVISPPVVSMVADRPRELTSEVYDVGGVDRTPLVASASLFRDSVRLFSADLTEVTTGDARRRGARLYQLALPHASVPAGRYLCQITVVDPATARFATMRSEIDIR